MIRVRLSIANGGDRGLVLVNALVIVLAIAAVSAAMLTLAAQGRARLGVTLRLNQLVLYLDGIQTLIPILLQREWQKNGSDHLGEFWATQGYLVPIDRGSVTASLTDRQGLLDVNRLIAPDDLSKAEFVRLFAVLGLAPSKLDALTDFLSENGPEQVAGYLNRPVALLPGGGRITLIEELRQIEGFDDAVVARLLPFVSALPELKPLNINTAPHKVLQAVLANRNSEDIALLIRERQRAPFVSLSDFFVRAEQALGEGAMDGVSFDRFDVKSGYFSARLRADLDGYSLSRVVLFHRQDKDEGATLAQFSYAVSSDGTTP